MNDKFMKVKDKLSKYKKLILKVTSAIILVSIILSQIHFYTSGYEKITDFYSYYTMLVTLLAAVILLISLFKDINIKIYFIVTIDVSIMLLIAPTIIPGFSVALFTLHFLVPVYLFIYLFLYYDTKELNDKLSIKDIRYILIFPAVYLLVVLVRGIIVNRFPYSFIEFSSQGILSIILFFLILVAIFIVIYFILYNVITSKYKHRYSLLSFVVVTGVLLLYIVLSGIVRTDYSNSNINYNQELFYIGEYNNKSLFKGYKDEGCYVINEQGIYEEFPYKESCLEYQYHSNNYLYNYDYETNKLSVYNPLDNDFYNIILDLPENSEVENITISNDYLYLKYIDNSDQVDLLYVSEKYNLKTMDKIYSFNNSSKFKITMYDTYYKMTIYEDELEEIEIDSTIITKQTESYVYYDINTLEEVEVNDLVRDKSDIDYLGRVIHQDNNYLYTYYLDRENLYVSNDQEYASFYIFKYDLVIRDYTYIKIPYSSGFRYSTSYYYGDRLYGDFYIDRIVKTDSNTFVLIEPYLDEITYYEISFDLEIVTNVKVDIDYNRLILDNNGNILVVATYRDIYAYRYTESIKTTYLDIDNNLSNEIFNYNYYI